ncbi:MAG TPA: hypothetical protein DC033_04795, partial [Akkermansia muciniphila]|nr:hypothetical protein [Akkermansia muciniphila]
MKMFGPHAPEAGSAAAFIKMLSRLRLFRRMFLKHGKFYFFMAVAANTGTRPFSFSITSYIKQYEPSLSGPLLSGFLVPAYAGGHQAGHHGSHLPRQREYPDH